MEKDLKNKTVVVTGGALGIGLAIAAKFAENGAKTLIILDINEAKGAEAVQKLTKLGVKAFFIKCDVTKDLDTVFNKIINDHKQVDVLVNNAGVCDETSVKKTLGINAVALIEWTLKFYEHMRKDRGGNGGTLVNISSMYGLLSDPFLPIYKASKHAVVGFTRTMGHELNYTKFGVRVFAICPGFAETALASNLYTQPLALDVRKEFNEFMGSFTWLSVEEVGQAIVDVFKKADSGTVWEVLKDLPVEPFPGYEKFSAPK